MSAFARLMLVFTSFAPILFTLAFVKYRQGGWSIAVGCYIAAAILMAAACALLLYESSRRIAGIAVTIESVKPADKETVGFVLAYLLPLINTSNVARVDPAVLWFVIGILALVVLTTNAYQFNPLLGFAGFHFYEVTTSAKVGFILITRRRIQSAKSIGEVIQLTEYMLLERSA